MRSLLATFALVTGLLTPSLALATAHVDEDAERAALNQLNRERVAAGQAPLRLDQELCDLARYHSADMALGQFVTAVSPRRGALVDRAAGAAHLKDTSKVRAYVSSGTDAGLLTTSLADPSLTRVGIGIVADGDRLFVTEVAVADPTAARPVYTPVPDAVRPTRMSSFLSSVQRVLRARGVRLAVVP